MLRFELSGPRTRLAFGSMVCFAALTCAAQPAPTSNSPLAPPVNGPRRIDTGLATVAITGATLHTAPGKTIDSGSLVFRAGGIERVETDAAATNATTKRDYTGMHIYAGFLEPYLEVDSPRPDPNAPGAHWNPRVTPQRSALDKGSHGVDAKTGQTLREMGFVAAAISPKGGLFRGTSAVVSLAPDSPDASEVGPRIYADRVFQTMSFELTAPPDDEGGPPDSSRWPRYPSSQMGAIALIRQTFSDADWQSAARAGGSFKESENALDALSLSGKSPMPRVLFDCQDELETLRAIAACDEFKRPMALLGSGLEFRRLAAIAEAKRQIILPLSYTQKPKVDTIGEADAVSLRELMTWEQAPTNPRRLDAAGLTVALTTSKIPEKAGGHGAFKDRLGIAIKHGLPADRALAMLTTNPATILGVEKTFGTLEAGKAASFVVADGPLFTDKPDAPGKDEPGYIRPGKIVEVWIDGVRYPVTAKTRHDLTGDWEITLTPPPNGNSPRIISTIDENNDLVINKFTKDENGKEKKATVKPTNVHFDDESVGGRFSFTFDHEPFGMKGVFISSGVVERDADGALVMHADAEASDGHRFTWTAKKIGPPTKEPKRPNLAGTWTILMPDGQAAPDSIKDVKIVVADRKATVKKGDKELAADTSKYEESTVVFTVKDFSPDKPEMTVWLKPVKGEPDRLSMSFEENGPEVHKLARLREKTETAEIAQIPDKLGLPFGPYALDAPPAQQTFVITGGTVWTCTDRNPETIENGVVVLSNGKIAAVGKAGTVSVPSGPNVVTVDARGKHVTPGIIDCHSHTGISKGVNEGGQAVTAEVRIGDVTDPDSLSWYRQLGGGVTSVNSLHGSANAIGGQNQVNKNRWGAVHPADMHFEGSMPGIKFALGENVKQSNWGDRFTTRYPQTRMGVETLIRDRFTAAREYLAAMKSSNPPRRDLELECLGEILEGKRLIHCHSYRQDEILMLCRVARDFGFKLGTFQHGLECYKVADEVRESARGASLFSDWWAYEMEVVDAIPYAGPILFSRGVPVSYNSDSDDLARRLNVEAGKAWKYAAENGINMSQSDALKFVTLNPAKQLAIESRVGSLETGKDADVVIWSGVPFSSMTRAEETFVDGRLEFSLERDAELRAGNQRERQRITQKILAMDKKPSGEGDKGPGPAGGRGGRGRRGDPPPTDADDNTSGAPTARRSLLAEALHAAEDARANYFMDLLRRGIDPQYHRGAECGCDVWMNN